MLIRPFRPTSEDIARRVVARVMALSDEEVIRLLGQVLGEFADRHEQVEQIFGRRFLQVRQYLSDPEEPSPQRQALIDLAALQGDVDVVERATRIASLSTRLNDPAQAARWYQKAVDAGGSNDAKLLKALADAQIKAGLQPPAAAASGR